jgi:hypothetical protein
MKGCQFLLILVFAAFGVSASALDERLALPYNANGMHFPTEATRHFSHMVRFDPNVQYGPTLTRASIVGAGLGAARELRSTTGPARLPTDSGVHDSWLMALAAAGMIFLQLRRKHRSLPQRPVSVR